MIKKNSKTCFLSKYQSLIGLKSYYCSKFVKSPILDNLTKSLSLVSWHVFTIFLFTGTVTLIIIAYNPAYGIAAYPIIIINAIGALLFICLGFGNHTALLKMPGAYLMALTAIFSYLGIIS